MRNPDVVHIIITPPDEDTTPENLGVVSIPRHCASQADAIRERLTESGFLANVVLNPPVEFDQDGPERTRGREYLEGLS